MTATQTNIHQIPLGQIEPSPFQPRRHFAPDEMEELAASIRDHGVLQPVVARPLKKGKQTIYQLVAGERRWRAAQKAELETIPANIRRMSDLESALIALVENSQREDVDDWGTAMALRRYMEESEKAGEPLSERALARKLNKSVSYVRNFLGLFKLPDDVQGMVQRNEQVRSAAFEIARIDDHETRAALIQVVDKGGSYQDVKKQVDKVLSDEAWKRESRAPDADMQAATRRRSAREREARQAIAEALREAETKLQTAVAWAEYVDSAEYSAQVERVQRQLEKLKP